MKKIKVVTIGGGSSYTPELIEGFIKRYEIFPLSEIWLVDVEHGKEKLEIIGELTRRMFHKANLDVKVYTTLNRREALVDADFVTTQLRVGFLDARIKDERISIEHGVIGQETNGAGGMFKALRTIPVILDIVKDIQELCPNAWLINFTNPAGMVTQAIFDYTTYKNVIGLCNVPIEMQFSIAKLLDVAVERITLELQGLNHHNFVTKVLLDDKDITADLLNMYLDSEMGTTMQNIVSIPFSKELIASIKAIPNDYLNYYINTAEQLEKQQTAYKNHELRAELVREIEEKLFEIYKNLDIDYKPEELEKRGGAHYSDAACSLITSIYNDTGDIQYINTLNGKAVSNMDPSDVLECACYITKDGPKPLPIGKFDPKLLGTIRTIKAFELMTSEAAVTGNQALAIAALALNPLIPSEKIAHEVFADLLEAHQEFLPNFK